MGLRSREGQDIKEIWQDRIRTYLGMTFSGFPNTFMVYSPQAPSALSNGITMIEMQADWVTSAIEKLEREGVSSFEPTKTAEDDWDAVIEDLNGPTLFPFTDSWWNKANLPGKKGFSLEKKPVKRSIARRSRWRGYDDASGPRQLEFISEHLVESSLDYGETRAPPAPRSSSQAANRTQQRPSSNDESTASNSRLPDIGMPGHESDMMNARADPSAEDIYMYNENTSVPEPDNLNELGAEEFYSDNEIPIVAAPLDLDEPTSFNTILLPSSPNSPINEQEFHLDPNYVENQSQVGIPSDMMFDSESTIDELADGLDGSETVTSPELSHRPFAAASMDIRASLYHFLQTIPPRPLYTGQFEWLEPIFERCNNFPRI
ncbi:hypothetical protein LTS17_010285 [Exophiala oligosperma]